MCASVYIAFCANVCLATDSVYRRTHTHTRSNETGGNTRGQRTTRAKIGECTHTRNGFKSWVAVAQPAKHIQTHEHTFFFSSSTQTSQTSGRMCEIVPVVCTHNITSTHTKVRRVWCLSVGVEVYTDCVCVRVLAGQVDCAVSDRSEDGGYDGLRRGRRTIIRWIDGTRSESVALTQLGLLGAMCTPF